MLGHLTPEQIEALLKHQLVGRIACHAHGETYIVPISYAYDGRYIYCHTGAGKKVHMMRTNPSVCFEVEDTKDTANWQSVVLQGIYEELTNTELRSLAIENLLNRYLPVLSSITTHLGEHWPFHPGNEKDIEGIVFRIAIKEKTGRFETSSQSPYMPG